MAEDDRRRPGGNPDGEDDIQDEATRYNSNHFWDILMNPVSAAAPILVPDDMSVPPEDEFPAPLAADDASLRLSLLPSCCVVVFGVNLISLLKWYGSLLHKILCQIGLSKYSNTGRGKG